MYFSRQQKWLCSQKEDITISYYVIEGRVFGVPSYRKWLEWQYIVTPSHFVKSCIAEMGVKVREVIPHQVDPNPIIDHAYGKQWRAKFPTSKKVLLYNGSQIGRKALPKLRQAINILSQKRNDFVMVFHTDNVRASFHTPANDLEGANTVVEREFPHLPLPQALAKMFYADIIVHPAVCEGFGLPILEALNMGKILVCINAYGVNEIANPSNSFMVQTVRYTTLKWNGHIEFKAVDYDPSDLADQISLALDSHREELDAKRLAGLQTAERFYHSYDRFTDF